jgi:hypothetical protein
MINLAYTTCRGCHYYVQGGTHCASGAVQDDPPDVPNDCADWEQAEPDWRARAEKAEKDCQAQAERATDYRSIADAALARAENARAELTECRRTCALLRHTILRTLTRRCTCDGAGPSDPGVCPACLVWHDLGCGGWDG